MSASISATWEALSASTLHPQVVLVPPEPFPKPDTPLFGGFNIKALLENEDLGNKTLLFLRDTYKKAQN